MKRTLWMVGLALSISISISIAACDKGGGGEKAVDAGTAPGGTSIVTGDIPAPSDVAAPPSDAQKTASGLASKVLQAGTGTISPERQDTVKVHYTGWTTDGKMFDSSVKRGTPATFGLGGVIKGWT